MSTQVQLQNSQGVIEVSREDVVCARLFANNDPCAAEVCVGRELQVLGTYPYEQAYTVRDQLNDAKHNHVPHYSMPD